MGRLFNGAVAGAVAWAAMDYTLRLLYNREAPEIRRREDRARDSVPAMEVMVDKLAGLAGVTLSNEKRQRGGTLVQWVTGVGAGIFYAAFRDHIPGSGLRRGIVYGAGFSLVVDEGLTPALGFAPGPLAFPWQTHARGFAGHLVYGVAAEVMMQWLERSTDDQRAL